MKRVSVQSLALAAISLGATLGWAAQAAKANEMGLLNGDEPGMPVDPSTVKGCTYWYDHDGSVSCSEIPFVFGISQEQFAYWNPVAAGCTSFPTGKSYCVEGPAPVTTTTTQRTTTTSAKPTTTTPPGNGIATPTPIQDGMVKNCNKFDFVEGGVDSCSSILSRNKLTIAQFYAMNPEVKNDCTGMWANVYVCVGLIGGNPTTTPAPTTTKPPGNGIATPTPIQEGMVDNCNKFYFVEGGVDTCATVLSKNKLVISQLYAMNPGVKSDCTGLWANVYVCVSTTKGTPTTTTTRTTTTKPGNGISTPTPTQDGMVNNCDKFYFVNKGTSCSTVLSTNKITIAQFFAWNPAVGKDCTNMWAEVYQCVSIVGHTPARRHANYRDRNTWQRQ